MIIRYLVLFLITISPSFILANETYSIVDDEGSTYHFDKPFTRIISLYPAHTENLATLGAEASLIGISTSDNYPSSILEKPRFSYRDNPEKFLAASPDLILIRPMISRSQPELIKKLRTAGVTILSLQPTSQTAMFSYWEQLGKLAGREESAREMIAKFQATLADLQEGLPTENALRPKVYFESIHSKMKTFAPEAISIFVLTKAGGVNIATDAVGRNNSNIAPYGKERILSRGPEIDIFLSQVGRMNRIQLEDIYKEPGFSLIRAVRESSVHLIDEEVVSRPTMRLLEGIRQIRGILYPDITG